jgi:hypothetical protein
MTGTRSTVNSTIKGKAYEYAAVVAFVNQVSPIRPVNLIENSSLEIARSRFQNDVSETEREEMLASATSGIGVILKMEPRIVEDGDDPIDVLIQADNVAKKGDIRDVLVIRRDITWEIGVSVKHNHEALKHSRLSATLDFAQLWFNLHTSSKYFSAIAPVFASLQDMKSKGLTWKSLEGKQERVYLPVLEAFMAELKTLYQVHGSAVTRGLIHYLLGSNGADYYKMIHYNHRITRVIPFNLFGSLNQASNSGVAETAIPPIDLPTKIIDISLKEDSQTTVILTMDNGWSISFRIHSASTIVEPSLKFDIQLIGQPANLFFLDVAW